MRTIAAFCAGRTQLLQRHPGLLALIFLLSTDFARCHEQFLTETDWTADIPKVFYATRQEQSITSAPSSVTVINREMIKAQGAVNLAEILHLVPGFQVFYSNGMTFGVTPHGFSDRYPKRLEVRVNGRSVYLPQLSSVAWESLGILPEDIDHIEVVRGSNVPSYGSNAIMGAINIVTHNPVQEEGGTVTVTSGSAGTEVINFRQHLTLDSNDVMLRIAHKENNGFKGLDDGGRVEHLVVSSVHTPGLANTVELEFGISSGDLGIGDGDHPDEFADDHRRATWINTSWQHESAGQLWKLHFSYTDYEFDHSWRQNLSDVLGVTPGTIPLLIPGQVDEPLELLEGKREFHVANLELEHHIRGDQWRLLWGLGSRKDWLQNQEFIGRESVGTYIHYAFSNIEWHLTRALELNAGFMLEDKEGFDTDLSPRLALNYHISEEHHLRGSATRAYRQPAILESDLEWTIRFADGYLLDLVEVSAKDVTSERVDTYELGYIGYWLDGAVGVDIKLFREEVSGEIDSFDVQETNCTNPMPEQQALASKYCPDFFIDGQYGAPFDKRVRVFANVADWNVEGLEAQVSWKPGQRSWLRFNYAWLRSAGRWERRLHSTPYVSEMTDFLPEYTAGLLFSYSAGGNWNYSGHWRYMDYVSWRSGTNVHSHTRLDAKIAKSWRFDGGETELALTVQNALNTAYVEFQNMNDFRRRILFSFTYRWSP